MAKVFAAKKIAPGSKFIQLLGAAETNQLVEPEKAIQFLEDMTPSERRQAMMAGDEVVIPPTHRALVGTGVAILMPNCVYGRVAPRSGLAVKHGVQVGAGGRRLQARGVWSRNLGHHPRPCPTAGCGSAYR